MAAAGCGQYGANEDSRKPGTSNVSQCRLPPAEDTDNCVAEEEHPPDDAGEEDDAEEQQGDVPHPINL